MFLPKDILFYISILHFIFIFYFIFLYAPCHAIVMFGGVEGQVMTSGTKILTWCNIYYLPSRFGNVSIN